MKMSDYGDYYQVLIYGGVLKHKDKYSPMLMESFITNQLLKDDEAISKISKIVVAHNSKLSWHFSIRYLSYHHGECIDILYGNYRYSIFDEEVRRVFT